MLRHLATRAERVGERLTERDATVARLRTSERASALASGFSTAAADFSKFTAMLAGTVPSTDATRVESVRRTLANAGFMVFTAVSILPATGAKTDVDMASSAIAIIMPPWAWSSDANDPMEPGTGA